MRLINLCGCKGTAIFWNMQKNSEKNAKMVEDGRGGASFVSKSDGRPRERVGPDWERAAKR